MQFVRYESFRQYLKRYPITSLILAVNVIMFIIVSSWSQAGHTMSESMFHFGAMYKIGAADTGGDPLYAPFWRYLASVFLHFDLSHLLFNCFSTLVFAPALERMLGSLFYLGFYLLCGLAGNVASQFLREDTYLGAGASGAIYGVFGAFLFMGIFTRSKLDKQSRQTVIGTLAIGVIYSIAVPNIDLYAHLGGLAGGFVLAALLSRRIKEVKPTIIAGIFAHPDDESFGVAAAFHQAAGRGCQIVGYCATAGEAGIAGQRLGLTPEQLAAVRVKELERAINIIGYSAMDLRGLPDKGLTALPAGMLIEEVVGFVDKHKPDVIVTFPEDGLSGHPDHIAIHHAVREAVASGRCPSVQKLYYIASGKLEEMGHGATVTLDVTPFAEMKRQALLAHDSQYPASIERFFGDIREPHSPAVKNFPKERFVLVWERGTWFPGRKEKSLTDGLK